MSDSFINTVFSDVLKKMAIDPPSIMNDFQLVIDDEHPVLLRYDAPTEKIMVLAMLDTDSFDDKEELNKRLLKAGLNPLLGKDPGVGFDEKADCCFSYLTLPRQRGDAEEICHEIGRLIEWNKQLLTEPVQ